MSKVSVGKCPTCGQELKVKALAVKANLYLTCKCGNRIHIQPDEVAITESTRAANTVEHQLSLLSKRIGGKKADLALMNFVNAYGFTKAEIVQAATDVLSGAAVGDRFTAVSVLAHLNVGDCIDALVIALRDNDVKVRQTAARAFVKLGNRGTTLLRSMVGDLTINGFTEASEELSNVALEFEKTHDELRKVIAHYPGEIICVYNKDVFLSEIQLHITNYNLTDDDLHRLADELKAEGYRVTDATPHSSCNFRFRGIAVFPQT